MPDQNGLFFSISFRLHSAASLISAIFSPVSSSDFSLSFCFHGLQSASIGFNPGDLADSAPCIG